MVGIRTRRRVVLDADITAITNIVVSGRMVQRWPRTRAKTAGDTREVRTRDRRTAMDTGTGEDDRLTLHR